MEAQARAKKLQRSYHVKTDQQKIAMSQCDLLVEL